jgi:hypothetical protein
LQALLVANSLVVEKKDSTLARCYLPISFYRVAMGQYEQAEQVLAQSMQICVKLGDARLLEECYLVKLNILEYTVCIQFCISSSQYLFRLQSPYSIRNQQNLTILFDFRTGPLQAKYET